MQMLQSDWLSYSYTISHYSSPLKFAMSALVKTDHVARSLSIECPRATIRHYSSPLNFLRFLLV